MIKKLLLILIVFIPNVIFSQVGINTENPNSLTLLDVSLAVDGTAVVPKGVMIPRMTQTQRDQIDTSNPDLANSLVVYNTDEDCFNYFSKTENSWVSLCGLRTGDAVFTVDCDQASVKGNYMVNTDLVTSNYVVLTVVVTKAGNYNISAVPATDNGYYFSAMGEFIKTGTYSLRLPGIGTPITANEAGDRLLVQSNNELLCDNLLVKINPARYTLDCSSIIVSGNYIATIPLTNQNTIQIKVTADAALDGYVYDATTPIVNGYSFSATGTLVAGDQIITLVGSGTPIKNGTNTFILENNTAEGIPSCQAQIDVAPRPVRILTASSSSVAYNLGNSSNYANRALMNPDYFSLNSGATYANSGFVFNSVTSNGRLEASMTSFNPDIIIAQFNYSPTTSEITALTNFVNKGGVFIYCTDNSSSSSSNILPLVQSIFDGNTGIQKGSNDNDNVVTLLNTGTAITDGPFKNLVGLGMARDAGSNFGLVTTSLPSDQTTVIAYSDGGAAVRMLAHKTKGFVFIGDGGPFGSSNNTTSGYSSPAKFIIENGKVVAATDTGSTPDSYNSSLLLNTIVWAIDYIKNSGFYQ